MPIYEYRCEACGRISEFLLFRRDEPVVPRCKRCRSERMSRVLSRVRVVRSEEDRLESLADPSRWGDVDENDPASMARLVKRMGREMGEDMSDMDEALEEELGSGSGEKSGPGEGGEE
jgi:putative FmdB family regulatory protein